MSLLNIDGLTVTFDRAAALREVSLEVSAGEVVGVLGANGAGKTTLLRAIIGRAPKAAGSITFDGRDVTRSQTHDLVKAGMSLCLEGRRLFPNMTIHENLLLGAHGRPRAEVAARTDSFYDRFDWMGPRRGELAGRLSGGEQQAVAIARALMSEPKLLLLDEPSSGLSPVAIEQVRSILEDVCASGTTVLLVEQNIKLVVDLCRTAWVLARGQVQDHGPVSELMAGVRLEDAYLGGIEQVRPTAEETR